MPFVFEKKLIPPSLDRRRKLSDAQKAEIESRYKAGGVSQRQLAAEYGVSRKLISLIVDPDAMERNRQYIKEHWRDHYDTRKNTLVRREFRANKKELDARGLLQTADSVSGVPDGSISDTPTMEQDMAIPNYLKEIPIRCQRSDKVREVANILIHLQHHKVQFACVDVYVPRRGKLKCEPHTFCLTEDLDGNQKKSKTKLVEIAASLCGNRKRINTIKLFGENGHKDYLVEFPAVAGRPSKADK